MEKELAQSINRAYQLGEISQKPPEIQGGFFNWPPPKSSKCQPVSEISKYRTTANATAVQFNGALCILTIFFIHVCEVEHGGVPYLGILGGGPVRKHLLTG